VVPSRAPGVSGAAIERESVRILRELSRIAAPHGVRLAYEFLGFADCTVNTLASGAAIVEKVGPPQRRAGAGHFSLFRRRVHPRLHPAGGSAPDLHRPHQTMWSASRAARCMTRCASIRGRDPPLGTDLQNLRAIGYAGGFSVRSSGRNTGNRSLSGCSRSADIESGRVASGRARVMRWR